MNAVQQLSALAPVRDTDGLRVGRRNRYFQYMAIFLFIVMLTGFAPTYFLRSFFRVPPIPAYVYVHGALMTAWFTLLVVQTSLIRAHRIAVHRRLGILGALLAVAVAGGALVTTLAAPARFSLDPSPLDFKIQIFWGNFGLLTLFCTFVAIAIWMRGRPETHKRLLLLASITMIGPAFGRYIGRLAAWHASSSGSAISLILLILVYAVVVALPLTLVVHDLRTAHRLRPATLWGVIGYFVVEVGTQFVIAPTAFGHAVVAAWRG